MKLALVIDKSEAYRSFTRDRLLLEWGLSKENTQEVSAISEVGSSTLFGGSPASIIHIDSIDVIKKTFEQLDSGNFDYAFDSGLIITTDVNRNSTKKLEALISKAGGSLHAPPGKKEESIQVKILSELSLSPEVRKFVLSYVGEDYVELLPLVNAISKLPPAAQRKVSIEDVYIRFPQPPGNVAPWEIETPLMRGDVKETLSIYRRIETGKSGLLALAVIKNKVTLSFRAAVIKTENPRATEAQIAEYLGVPNNYPLKLAIKSATKYGLNIFAQAVQIVSVTEAKVKGGSAAPMSATIESGLVKLCRLFG